MKKHLILLVVLFGGLLKVMSQSQAKPYAYVVVPLQYEFLEAKDKYRLNTLTRVLLKKEGFNVYFNEGEPWPEDLTNNRCLAMYADVHKLKGGFLKTKLKMSFKDCYGNLILESEEGVTKEKDFAVAYKDALNKAFLTLDFSKITNNTTSVSKADTPVTPEIVNRDEKQQTNEVKEVTAEMEEVALEAEKGAVEVKESVQQEDELEVSVLYAQPITNGFQLVDTTPKKVMVLLKTANPNVFVVKGKAAIVYSENGQWFYSETTERGYDVLPLTIKF